MKTYVELVPRDLAKLTSEAKTILKRFPVTGINIPDVLRLENRSYQAAQVLLDEGIEAIPHIRTIDQPLEETVSIIEGLVEKGLQSVLLIHGDPPPDPFRAIYEVSPVRVTRVLRQHFPNLDIYCGLDPYRTSFHDEILYAHKKIDAGAKGLFTQPMFDIRLAEIYTEQLKDTDLFLGISPVLTETSYQYWVSRNLAIFPEGFDTSLPSNVLLAKQLISMASEKAQNVYLMPIKAPILEYLSLVYS